jgi:hypothetical protein
MFVIEKEYWMHLIEDEYQNFSYDIQILGNNGDKWVPNYLIKSPRQIKTYQIRESDVNHVVLLIKTESMIGLKKGIREYIHWGEAWQPINGQKYPLRPTCKSRRNWFELPVVDQLQFKFICLMTINDRFPIFNNPRGFLCDARFYGIRFQKAISPWILSIYLLVLNSIFSTIQIELLGRRNLGEGGLDIKVYEYALLKVPTLETVKSFSLKTKESILISMIQSFHDSPPFIISSGDQDPMFNNINEVIADLLEVDIESIHQIHRELQSMVRARILKARVKDQ